MITTPSRVQTFVESGLKVSLLLLALSAPISIAATQTAWALALFFWLLRMVFVRPAIKIDSLGVAVLAFVGLSLVSSIFSYEPEVSLRKMVAVSLVTIVYLVVTTVKDRRFLGALAGLLIAACAASCVYTFATQVIGKNLKVVTLAPNSPLRTAGILENDTILTAGEQSVQTPEDLITAAANGSGERLSVVVARQETLLKFYLTPTKSFDPGILDWTRGRDTRAAGFYGHYTTFAEALQLIGSLALGLLLVVSGDRSVRMRFLLGAALAAIGLALFLTVTRASWVGFAISATVIILLSANRRALILCVLLAVPIAAAALIYMQQMRNVSFIDSSDGSTTWRLTVWREGVNVLFSEPRHLAVGIGMDSLKTHWQDWHMFDNGKQPIGHLHSTPLQLAFERGIPVLIAWVVWLFLYLRTLWRSLRDKEKGWLERGVILGSFGGTIGFLSSGLVHYNWGDSEVVMILYLMMGLSLAASKIPRTSDRLEA